MNKQILQKLTNYFGEFRFAVFSGEKKSRWIVKPKQKNLAYLRAMNARGNHIFIKPVNIDRFMLADDLTADMVTAFNHMGNVWKPGRMIIETSPENYQVWVRFSSPVMLEFKRYWLKRMKSDPGADPHNRWGRSPGFRNRKPKYRTGGGGYPLSRLIWIDWALDAEPPPFPSTPRSIRRKFADTPQVVCNAIKGNYKGGVCANNISRTDYKRSDRSSTDFAFALALMRRGADDSEVEARIRTERTEWGNHSGAVRMNGYLGRTVQKARYIWSQSQ